MAITSFETRIPKYFSKSVAVVSGAGRKGGYSHFDRIPTYNDWNETTIGYRDRLKEELANVERVHENIIETKMDNSSKAFAIAKLSLKESVSWVVKLISYIDDTYSDLVRHNTFVSDKAWQLTTQLARRIFMEVSLPRQGIQNLINVGDNVRIGPLILWPIIKSHDIMKRYKDASFKDDPTIASEYVKFFCFQLRE
jgi:hypothetical protein